jgi:hypothetical protein
LHFFAFSSAGQTNETPTRPRSGTKEAPLEDESDEQVSLQSDSEDEEDNAKDSSKEDDNDDVTEDLLEEETAAMSLNAKATIKLPLLLYTWSKDRQQHCSVDILLLSGTSEDHIQCKINKNGQDMTVSYKLPGYFLSSRRLVAGSNGKIDAHHSKASALNKAIDDYHEAFDFEDPVLEFKVKLPFKVENKIVCEVVWYHHDNKELRAEEQFYYMLHVDLTGSDKPREMKQLIPRRKVGSPDVDDDYDVGDDLSMRSGPNVVG